MLNEEKAPEDPAAPTGGGAQSIRWVRLVTEATAIVLSILVAFAIDAGWEDLRERGEEQEILAGIQRDMQENLTELKKILVGLQNSHESFARFMDATPGELGEMSDSAVTALMSPIVIPGTFNPYQGALASALSSGKLQLLRDPLLREELGAWIGRVADSAEEGPLVVAAADRIQGAMVNHGALVAFARGIGVLEPHPRSDLSAAVAALRLDDDFINAGVKRTFIAAIYMNELIELRDYAESVLSLIDANLR